MTIKQVWLEHRSSASHILGLCEKVGRWDCTLEALYLWTQGRYDE